MKLGLLASLLLLTPLFSSNSQGLFDDVVHDNDIHKKREASVLRANIRPAPSRVHKIFLNPAAPTAMAAPESLSESEKADFNRYVGTYTTLFSCYNLENRRGQSGDVCNYENYPGYVDRQRQHREDNLNGFVTPEMPESLQTKLTTEQKAELSRYLSEASNYIATRATTVMSGLLEGDGDSDFPQPPAFYDPIKIASVVERYPPDKPTGIPGIQKLIVERPAGFDSYTEDQAYDFYCAHYDKISFGDPIHTECLGREYSDILDRIEQQAQTGIPLEVNATTEFRKFFADSSLAPRSPFESKQPGFVGNNLLESMQRYSNQLADFYAGRNQRARDYTNMTNQEAEELFSQSIQDATESCVSFKVRDGQVMDVLMTPDKSANNYACRSVSNKSNGWTGGRKDDYILVFMNEQNWNEECNGLQGVVEIREPNDEGPRGVLKDRVATRGVWVHKDDLEKSEASPEECLGQVAGEFNLDTKTEAQLCGYCLSTAPGVERSYFQLEEVIEGVIDTDGTGLSEATIDFEGVDNVCLTSVQQRSYNVARKTKAYVSDQEAALGVTQSRGQKSFQAQEARQNSPWRNYELEDRIRAFTDIAGDYIDKNNLGFDPRYLTCIGARETHGFIEPMMTNYTMYDGQVGISSAQGTTAVVISTALGLTKGMHGRKVDMPKILARQSVPSDAHEGIKYTTDSLMKLASASPGATHRALEELLPHEQSVKMHEMMGCFPDLQIWFGAMALFSHILEANNLTDNYKSQRTNERNRVIVDSITENRGRFTKAQIEKGLMDYYGSGNPRTESQYKNAISRCYSCLTKRVNENGIPFQSIEANSSTDPAGCLYSALPGGTSSAAGAQEIRRRFKDPEQGVFFQTTSAEDDTEI